jgi:quinoprotein relay system zinc metallohydrolase 2
VLRALLTPALKIAAAAGLALAIGTAAATEPALRIESLGDGVHVHFGRHAEISSSGDGDVANFGFIVGSRCVAVIDTGASLRAGRALRQEIARVTPLPVCFVINTHGHPDHVLGNAAFEADQPEFVGHAKLAAALARRAPLYLRALQRDLGAAMEGTRIVAPTLAVSDRELLDLGGRKLELRAWPTGHTDHDLTVFDPASGTLWTGDLVFEAHLPVVDGSLRGYLTVLDQIGALPARKVVAGHGRARAWPAAIEPQRRYLTALLADVRAAIKSGRTLAQAMESIDYDARGQWQLFDAFHKRNVAAAYAELEWE